MKRDHWIVAAKVEDSIAAERTDASGDMEQLEQLDFIIVSEHETKREAEKAAAKQRKANEGWRYAVMRKRDSAALDSIAP